MLIRNATLNGRACDIRIAEGRVAEIGTNLRGQGPDIDAKGGEAIPGLIDHHIHLLAVAAEANSLVVTPDIDFAAALRARDRTMPTGRDLRVTGYHDSFHGPLDAARLDEIVPTRRTRVQYRTGSLWVLNSRALAFALRTGEMPDCVERDADGKPTGRIWRGDAWLRKHAFGPPPPIAPVGLDLARRGVTHVTDTSATTDDAGAAMLGNAVRVGALPQHLMLMSAQPLKHPPDAPWRLGHVKILLDDHDLPPVEAIAATIADARRQDRRVAVHCVTAGELAVTLAAFDAAGTLPGDRIEHGGVISPEAIPEIARLGLTVVTQPGFIAERGDRYLKDVEPTDHANLYRCASLIAAGIRVGGSTDAPYTRPDVWAAMRAAVHRTTRDGQTLGSSERISPRRALAMFQTSFDDPGGVPRVLEVGAPADIAILRDSFENVLADGAEPVLATIRAGEIAWAAT